MPLPHFLVLVLGVMALAGVTLVLAHSLGLPLVWLSIGAMGLAAVVRGLAWH
jgi:ABC-type nickel/cobalt efflux system permease component RcnA